MLGSERKWRRHGVVPLDGTTAGSVPVPGLGEAPSRDVWSLDDGGVIMSSRSTMGEYTLFRVEADGPVTTLANPPGAAIRASSSRRSHRPASGSRVACWPSSSRCWRWWESRRAGWRLDVGVGIDPAVRGRVAVRSSTFDVLWADVHDGEIVSWSSSQVTTTGDDAVANAVGEPAVGIGRNGRRTRLEYAFADDEPRGSVLPTSPRRCAVA